MSTALQPVRTARNVAPAASAVSATRRVSPFSPADLNVARALGQRFALAIELSGVGARFAYGEGASLARSALSASDPATAWKNERHAAAVAGERYSAGQQVVVYCASATETEARARFAGWGEIVELRPLFNTPIATSGTALRTGRVK